MIQAAERAHHLADGLTLNQLQDDRMRTESLLWNFTVLGEAATQLSSELKDQFPRIPWQQPARLRNRIVHGYWSIDMEILHTTATDQLPTFARDLREVLHTLTGENGPSTETPAQARSQQVGWVSFWGEVEQVPQRLEVADVALVLPGSSGA